MPTIQRNSRPVEVYPRKPAQSAPAPRKALQAFRLYSLGGIDLALASAVQQRILRSRGETLPDIAACLLATFCIQINFALLHADPGFGPFERHLGLKVPDPGTPL